MRPVSDDEVIQGIEARSLAQQQRTRELLLSAGRADLVLQLDAKLKDIRTGVEGAKAIWHSISEAQRRLLETLRTGRVLYRNRSMKTRYDAHGEPHAIPSVCSLATIRALCARDLLHVDGGAMDPERKFVLTERACFVMAHGKSNDDGTQVERTQVVA